MFCKYNVLHCTTFNATMNLSFLQCDTQNECKAIQSNAEIFQTSEFQALQTSAIISVDLPQVNEIVLDRNYQNSLAVAAVVDREPELITGSECYGDESLAVNRLQPLE